MRRVRNALGVMLLCLLCAEITGHITYSIRDGQFLWKNSVNPVEEFRVQWFLESVDDERKVIPKKRFTSEDPSYKFSFDRAGFRGDGSSYDITKHNIVFLGDSVPFGWGLYDFQSEPQQFFQILQKNGYANYGVINAAVPSFSLRQAIYKYIYELSKSRWPIHTVVLQTVSPVSELVSWGKNWTHTISAATESHNSDMLKWRRLLESTAGKYSSIIHTIGQVGLNSTTPSPLDIHDQTVKQYFQRENEADLQLLYDLLQSANIQLVLVSTNPAQSNKKMLAAGSLEPYVHAVDWFNDSLKQFADTHDQVFFIDMIDAFDTVGRQGLFIDKCCHLSATGAALQAQFLFNELKTHNILPP